MMSRGTLIMSNQSFVLRVYYDHDTPLTLLPTGEYAVTQAVDIPRPFLEPPAPEKEFLLSPPGSPPVGWEQQKEDRPNTQALSDDLIKALHKLSMERRRQRQRTQALLHFFKVRIMLCRALFFMLLSLRLRHHRGHPASSALRRPKIACARRLDPPYRNLCTLATSYALVSSS